MKHSYLQQTFILTLVCGVLGAFLFVTVDDWRADLNQWFQKGVITEGTVTKLSSIPNKWIYEVYYVFKAPGRSGKEEQFEGRTNVRPETISRLHEGDRVRIRHLSSNPEISGVDGEKNFRYAFPIVAYLLVSFVTLVLYRYGRVLRGMA